MTNMQIAVLIYINILIREHSDQTLLSKKRSDVYMLAMLNINKICHDNNIELSLKNAKNYIDYIFRKNNKPDWLE